MARACSVVLIALVLWPSTSAFQSVQIVDYDQSQSQWLFYPERLEAILPQSISNLPLCVVAVTGARRTGKSLLLNYMVRYLEADEAGTSNNGDWMGSPGDAAEAFITRSGRRDTTMGVWIYSKVFRIHRYGREIVVILIDSEGLFGRGTDSAKSARIYAMSSILSSITIFNIMRDANSQDIINLALFELTGRTSRGASEHKPFQKLMFMIRDWADSDEMPYGISNPWLNEVLGFDMRDEPALKDSKQSIRDSYDFIQAYLMPAPGRDVNRQDFNGSHGAFDDEFRHHVKNFIQTLFEDATVKSALGRVLNSQTFLETFRFMAAAEFDDPPNIRESFMNMVARTLKLDIERDFRPRIRPLIENRLDEATQWRHDLLNEIQNRTTIGLERFSEIERASYVTEILNSWKQIISEKIDDAIIVELKLIKERMSAQIEAERLRLTDGYKLVLD